MNKEKAISTIPARLLAAALALTLFMPASLLAQDDCSTEKDPATHTKVGQQMPAFTVAEPEGTNFSLADQHGKITVINFWATWCGPCKYEIPRLEKEVWQKYKDNPRFAMVAIAREQTAADITPFRAATHFSFPIASDPARSTYKLFADSGIPRSYVVDGTGKILFQTVGYCPAAFDQLTQAVAKALADPK